VSTAGQNNALIRRAVPQDALRIAEVRVESWQQTYKGLIPESYLNDMRVEDSALLWERVLEAASDAACTFVLEVNGDICGFASGITLADNKHGFDAELTGVYVLPQVQRNGVGRRLVGKVAATLAQAGATNLLVWVLAEHRAGREFFEAIGAELKAEKLFDWDGYELKEVGYGWPSIRVG
jgi:GNAT superfamily N-acetyltransferase